MVQINVSMEHVERHLGGRIRDAGTLFMLFMSGESQITKAFHVAGIKEATSRIVVVYKDQQDLINFTRKFPGIVEDEGIPEDAPEHDKRVFGNVSRVELNL